MDGGRSEARATVLVCEDDPGARTSMLQVLQESLPGVTLLGASGGLDAWQRLLSGNVDLLLSDVAMPELDGVELARMVRQHAATQDTYVILITGVSPPETLFGAVDDGADDCLIKPVRAEELVVRVKAGLRRVGFLRRLKARAQELERLYTRQSEFLSMVSHEIRTPLSAILSSANILLRYGTQRPDSVERFARVIHQEGQRLTRLINNLLDLAKIESGQMEWRFAPLPVADMVGDVRESFSALAGERNLGLELACERAPLEVVADRDKLVQVVLNLVSNAIKHSPERGVVHLRCLPRAGGGVRLEVEDEGPGVPPGLEERIFERFHQADNGEETRGTGLGLTIARQIVEHHGGRVWAEPSRARGALFVVELPQRPPAEAAHGSV